jgi:hypothetical protein
MTNPVRPVLQKMMIIKEILYKRMVIYSKTGIMEVTTVPEKVPITVSMILKML